MASANARLLALDQRLEDLHNLQVRLTAKIDTMVPQLVRLDAVDERLDEQDTKFERLIAKLDVLVPAVARLEVKAGAWGAVGGLMAVVVSLAVAVLARMTM